jgi:2-hydroxychromene-2-carboxylate isomerase
MTMAPQFLFDFGSPNAYLAHRAIPTIEARTGANFEYLPVLLGGVFKLTGNVSPAVSLQGIKNKGEYGALEMRRFQQEHGIDDFQFNPHFPVNTLQLMRGCFVAQREGVYERYVDEVFRSMWCDPKKMDDPAVIQAALEEAELPAAAILAGIQEPEIKSQLMDQTKTAVERGVFGSPAFFVGSEHYFGKDRLEAVEREILDQKP